MDGPAAGADGLDALEIMVVATTRNAEIIRIIGEAGFTAAVLDYLQDWVVCHIQTEDRGMARHLNQDGH